MNVELLEQSVSKVATHRQRNVSKVSVAILLPRSICQRCSSMVPSLFGHTCLRKETDLGKTIAHVLAVTACAHSIQTNLRNYHTDKTRQ